MFLFDPFIRFLYYTLARTTFTSDLIYVHLLLSFVVSTLNFYPESWRNGNIIFFRWKPKSSRGDCSMCTAMCMCMEYNSPVRVSMLSTRGKMQSRESRVFRGRKYVSRER